MLYPTIHSLSLEQKKDGTKEKDRRVWYHVLEKEVGRLICPALKAFSFIHVLLSKFFFMVVASQKKFPQMEKPILPSHGDGPPNPRNYIP